MPKKNSILPCSLLGVTAGIISLWVYGQADPGRLPGSAIPLSLQQNEAPRVSILYPEAGVTPPFNTRIPYKIEVIDAEDGASKYDEIPSNEVLLEVRYVAAEVLKKGKGISSSVTDPGLLGIAASNCLFCHDFRAKLIGPSFYEISLRYKASGGAELGTLVRRIKEGSTGIWGDQVMPSHPELTSGDITAMLRWIEAFASRDSVSYYHGLEGTIELKTGTSAKADGIFVITSGYRDHGIEGNDKKIGRDQKVLAPGF